MSGFEHTPVLASEVLHYIKPARGKLYVDATIGGGGHSSLLLKAADCRLIGIDRDLEAMAAAREALEPFGNRAQLFHSAMSELPQVLAERGITKIDGLIADLGVSSHQLNSTGRGFSFSRPGPIDMRMDTTSGETALELIRRLSSDELATVIREYGEERFAARISRRLKDAVRAHELQTTEDLAQLVERTLPDLERRKRKIHPATKTFQALRIAVNGELKQLETLLGHVVALLAPGARCVIISFHSLEDRLVKNSFRDWAWSSSLPPQYALEAGERIAPLCRVLTRKVVVANDAEVAANPRARSAKLRACERCDD